MKSETLFSLIERGLANLAVTFDTHPHGALFVVVLVLLVLLALCLWLVLVTVMLQAGRRPPAALARARAAGLRRRCGCRSH